MTLLLTNPEIEQLLTMPECVAAVEASFRDLGEGQAANRPRSDLYAPSPVEDARYIFKSMEGTLPRLGVTALRLNSDTVRYPTEGKTVRKRKVPSANGLWVGLIFLFDNGTGEPLAIMPDGVIQRLRVGATNALAARELAAPDARVYGLLGSGWQAGAQVMALATVRDLEIVRVFSPSRENREAFAADMRTRTGLHVQPVETPEAAIAGAQIVGTATSSIVPVLDPALVPPGAHVTCVKVLEVHPGLVQRAAVTVVTTRRWSPDSYVVGQGEESLRTHDPRQAVGGAGGSARADDQLDLGSRPDLPDLLLGRVARPVDEAAVTCFVNVMGLGTQFAALAHLAYQRARAAGVGHELPTEWFLENVHP